MPIARINPDGTVKIFNSNTGETRDVKPEELAQYNPKMVGDYHAMVAKQEPQKPKESETPVQQLANVKAQKELQAIDSGQTPEDPKASGVLGFIDTLKSYYNQSNASGARPNAQRQDDLSAAQKPGWVGAVQGWKMGADAALNAAPDAKTYKRIKDGFTASLKEATGDTGVLTDQDYARIAHALPDFGDTDETARSAWEAVDQILVGKFGKAGKFSYLQQQPQDPAQNPGSIVGNVETGAPPIQPPTPPQDGLAVQTARQRVGQGALGGILDAVGKSAPQNAPVASAIRNPAFQDIFKILHPGVSGGVEQISKGELPTADQAKDAGIDLGLSTGVGLLGKLGSKLAQPGKLIGAMKKSAVAQNAGKAMDGSKLVKALEDGLETVSPTMKKAYTKALEQARSDYAGKKIPVEKAVDILQNANTAYNNAGQIGNSAAARFNDILSKALRSNLQTIAPQVSDANSLFSKLYRAQGMGKGVLRNIGGGIAGAAGVLALQKVMGGR